MTRIFYLLAPVMTIAVVYGSLMDMTAIPAPNIEHADKAYHGLAYFKLTIAWYLFFYKRFLDTQSMPKVNLVSVYFSWSRTIAIGASLLCFAIGALIELVQEWWTEERTMDILDVLANTSGIVIAALLIRIISKGYQSIQNRNSKSELN